MAYGLPKFKFKIDRENVLHYCDHEEDNVFKRKNITILLQLYFHKNKTSRKSRIEKITYSLASFRRCSLVQSKDPTAP